MIDGEGRLARLVNDPSPSPPRAPDPSPAETAARETVDHLLQAHGAEVHRYCAAMLGVDGTAALLPTFVGHLQAHATEIELEPEQARLVVLAAAHNRCIERSRMGGTPPTGEGLPPDAARAVRAAAQLKPVGRSAVVLRSLLGLRWHELERVCGLPTEQLVERTCRAWRNLALVADGGTPQMKPRPTGQRLSDGNSAWAAIRADAQRFVALRRVLRELLDGYAPEPGWQEDAWRRLELERAEQRRRAEVRAAKRAAAAKAEAERAAAEAEADAEAEAERAAPTGGAFSAVDEHEADTEPEAPSRRSWRWLAVGVVLAAVGLAARWLMLP